MALPISPGTAGILSNSGLIRQLSSTAAAFKCSTPNQMLSDGMNPTVTTLIGACLLRVVWRYTVFEAVGTVESMYWSYPVSWLLTFLIHLVYLERDRRKLMVEEIGVHSLNT